MSADDILYEPITDKEKETNRHDFFGGGRQCRRCGIDIVEYMIDYTIPCIGQTN